MLNMEVCKTINMVNNDVVSVPKDSIHHKSVNSQYYF